MDPQYGPQYGPPYGPHYGPPSNGVNSFERSIVNIRIDFENTVKPLNSGHLFREPIIDSNVHDRTFE